MERQAEHAQTRPDDAQIAATVELFSMLSDPTRLRLVLALGDGEHSVANLAEIVGKSPTAVSQHLAKLRLARVVVPRQEGTRVFYHLANEHVSHMVIDALDQAEHALGLPQDAVHRRPAF